MVNSGPSGSSMGGPNAHPAERARVTGGGVEMGERLAGSLAFSAATPPREPDPALIVEGDLVPPHLCHEGGVDPGCGGAVDCPVRSGGAPTSPPDTERTRQHLAHSCPRRRTAQSQEPKHEPADRVGTEESRPEPHGKSRLDLDAFTRREHLGYLLDERPEEDGNHSPHQSKRHHP